MIVLSINHDYKYLDEDYIFVSNLRRYRELDAKYYPKCIITSNIQSQSAYLTVDYNEFLIECEEVSDNAGLMAIKFLIKNEVEKIYIAGMDGYSYDDSENYSSGELEMGLKKYMFDSINYGMAKSLKELSVKVKLEFVTSSKYVVD